MVEEPPHVHRWRMETPSGPHVHGACKCGATRVDPAFPAENWGLMSDPKVRAAAKAHGRPFEERGDEI